MRLLVEAVEGGQQVTDLTIVLGKNADGLTVAEHTGTGVNGTYSFRFYLTPCCGADATGVSWGSGIACRACYAELPLEYGLLPGELAQVYGDGVPINQWRKDEGK